MGTHSSQVFGMVEKLFQYPSTHSAGDVPRINMLKDDANWVLVASVHVYIGATYEQPSGQPVSSVEPVAANVSGQPVAPGGLTQAAPALVMVVQGVHVSGLSDIPGFR